MKEEDSNKRVQEIKEMLEKSHGREFTWEEATKAFWDIKNIARLMLDMATREIEREKLLKESPKGFHLKDGGQCSICETHVSEENSWFDKYGIKCMICQKAIDTKIIPGSIAKDKESWYSSHELGSYFNIRGADLNKYLKQSLLKSRIIPGKGKNGHLQLFLMKDNKDVLPPKKLLKSRIIKIMHKGEEYHTLENWYEFMDEKILKKLAKYRIIECLKETFAKPIPDGGRLLAKSINPIFDIKK